MDKQVFQEIIMIMPGFSRKSVATLAVQALCIVGVGPCFTIHQDVRNKKTNFLSQYEIRKHNWRNTGHPEYDLLDILLSSKCLDISR